MTDLCASGASTYVHSTTTFNLLCGQDTTGPVLNIQSLGLEECAVACHDTAACKAVSWNYGTCYLKSAVGDIVPNEHVTSFVITVREGAEPEVPALKCPADNGKEYHGFTIACASDYPGIGDMGGSSQPSLESCIDSCNAASGCISAVWNGDGCYLKNKIGAVSENAHTIAVVKTGYVEPVTETPSTLTCPSADGSEQTIGGKIYQIICDKEYSGGDLAFAHAATFEECAATCSATDGCIDVSYRGNACYMKNKLTTLQTAEGVWTALLKGATSPADTGSQYTCPSTSGVRTYTKGSTKFRVTCGADYYGGDLTAIEAQTAEQCMDACAANSECKGAAYRGTGCYLKSTINPARSDEGVTGIEKIVGSGYSGNAPQCNEEKAFWGSHMGGGCSSGCYCNSRYEGDAFCVDDIASGRACRDDSVCDPGEFCDIGQPSYRGQFDGYCSNGKSCTSTYTQSTKRNLLAIGGGSARAGMGRSVLKRDEFPAHGRNYYAMVAIEAADNSTATA